MARSSTLIRPVSRRRARPSPRIRGRPIEAGHRRPRKRTRMCGEVVERDSGVVEMQFLRSAGGTALVRKRLFLGFYHQIVEPLHADHPFGTLCELSLKRNLHWMFISRATARFSLSSMSISLFRGLGVLDRSVGYYHLGKRGSRFGYVHGVLLGMGAGHS